MAISSEELRIGNLLTDDLGNLFTVTEIKQNKVICSYIRKDTGNFHVSIIDLCNVKPVEISEEILLKCGFVKLNHLGRNEFVLYIDENLSIEYIQDYGVRIVVSNENDDLNVNLSSFVCYYDKTKIKHLHQLQNLYYALTGTELPISDLK